MKTVLRMGNLRDGGLIVVGVSERKSIWQLDGISASHRATFEADPMASSLDKYVSPAPAVEIAIHERAGKKFLVLDVREFDEIPFVCKRKGPEDSRLERGAFYHRPLVGVPRTERITSAEDLRPIFEVAAQKGAQRILGAAAQLGLIGPGQVSATDDDRYDDELGDL